MVRTVLERAMDLLVPEPNTGCWLTTGSTNNKGYGQITVDGKVRSLHCVVFEEVRGPVPEGLVLDHVVCDTRPCANPFHVEPATSRANTLRGNGPTAEAARKTHCSQGHSLEDAKIQKRKNGKTQRRCIVCDRERDKKYYESRKTKA